MTYVNEEDNTYFWLKLFHAVAYTNNIQDLLEQLESFGIDFINPEALKVGLCLFETGAQTPKFSAHNFKNLLHFANYCRYHENSELYREEIYEASNRIMAICNSVVEPQRKTGYYSVLKKRYRHLSDILAALIYYCGQFESLQEEINDSIDLDFIILCTHSDMMDDETFKKQTLELIQNSLYLQSVEHLYHEYPPLFEDEQFLSRIHEVLRLNDKIFKEEEHQSDKKNKKTIFRKRNDYLISKLSKRKEA